MDGESKKTQLFARIKNQAKWIMANPSLREDLIQEAWLLACEYAEKRGKPYDELSSTEIKYRCLEAAKKVRSPANELPLEIQTEDGVIAREVVSPENVLEDILAREETNRYTRNAEKLAWVLINHPALHLTPRQAALWQIYRDNATGRWRAAYAREHGVTRQNISNITRVIKRKVQAGADLIRLWDGDVDYFFDRYNTGWAPAPIRNLIWYLFRDRADVKIYPEIIENFRAVQGMVLKRAHQLFKKERQLIQDGAMPDAKRLTLGYNLLISAARIDSESRGAHEMVQELSAVPVSVSWLIRRFALRGAHLIDIRERERHKAEIIEHITKPSEEGRRFAQYAIGYYAGFNAASTKKVLESDGRVALDTLNYQPVISRLYDNVRIPWYTQAPLWSDINFLRLALMATYFPFEHAAIPAHTLNAITTICQKTLHSEDNFVVSEAEKLLAKIGILRYGQNVAA